MSVIRFVLLALLLLGALGCQSVGRVTTDWDVEMTVVRTCPADEGAVTE